MKRLSIKAIVIGGIVDILSTKIFTAPLILYVVYAKAGIAHAPKDEQKDLIIALTQLMPTFKILRSIVGNLCSVLGGFAAGRIARHHKILNGAFASTLCFSLGLYGLFFSTNTGSLLEKLAHLFICPMLALFGGYLALKKQATLSASTESSSS